jgi:hypothetical protein
MASTGGTKRYDPIKSLKALDQVLPPVSGGLQDAMSGTWSGKGQGADLSTDPSNWLSAVQAADAAAMARTGKHIPGLEAMLLGILGQYEVNTRTGEKRPALPAMVQSLPEMPGMLTDTAQRSMSGSYTPNVEDPMTGRMYDPRETEDAYTLASLVMTGGFPMAAPAGSLRMFAGMTAKTADRAALAKAVQMEARSIPPGEIRKATGWRRGADNQWRFEIDDSAATVRPELLPQDESAPAVKLGDILSHEPFFKAYPHMKDMDVLAIMDPEIGGSFNDVRMKINPTYSPEDILNTVLHESQHGVQNKEGFTPGLDYRKIAQHPDPIVNKAYRQEFMSHIQPLDRGMFANILAKQNPPIVLTPEKFERVFSKFVADRQQLARRPSTPEYKAAKDKAQSRTYARAAGEVEARNVEKRAKMSAEERAATPPEDTQDLPNKYQLTGYSNLIGGSVPSIKPKPPVVLPMGGKMRTVDIARDVAPDDSPVPIKLGQRRSPRSDKLTDFMDAFENATYQHPFSPGERLLGDASVNVSPFGDKIHLSSLQSLAPGSGAGTRALEELKRMADEYGVEIGGTAKAYARDQKYITSTKRLVEWYRKHGFEILSGNPQDGYDIVYRPQTR